MKASKPRGYLSQLADPLPHAEALALPRPGAHLRSANSPVAAPSILDEQELPITQRAPKAAPFAVRRKAMAAPRRGLDAPSHRAIDSAANTAAQPVPLAATMPASHLGDRGEPQPAVLAAGVAESTDAGHLAQETDSPTSSYNHLSQGISVDSPTMEASRPAFSIAADWDRGSSPDTKLPQDAPGDESAPGSIESRGSSTSTTPSRDEPFVERPVHAEERSLKNEAIPRTDAETKLDIESGPDREKYNEKRADRHEPLSEPKRTPAAELAAQGLNSAKRARSVHIGNVEVRVKLAPPPAPSVPVAGSLQSHSQTVNASQGARPAAPQPLARGLAWSFGLVQG